MEKKQKNKYKDIDWIIRKSRLAKNISLWFAKNRNEQITFGQILDKYCEKGMGRIKVIKLLREMTKGEVRITDTSLFEAQKAAQMQGDCKFKFNAQWSGNPHHGNRGIIRQIQKIDKVPHENHPVIFSCQNCNKTFKEKANITKAPNLFVGLKTRKCPGCEKYGTLNVIFEIKQKTYHKTMIDGHEEFQKSRQEGKQCQKELVESLSEVSK